MKLKHHLSIIAGLLLTGLLLFVSCLESTIEPLEYGSVSGTVKEASSNLPLEGVEINSNPVSGVTYTDSLGNFSFKSIPVGNYSFNARLDGYQKAFANASVNSGINTEVGILMERETTIPGMAYNPVPETGSGQQARNLTLSWTSDPQLNDSLTFDVSVYESNQDTAILEVVDSRDTFVVLENLRYETTYFWQVTSRSPTGDETRGTMWNFSTVDFPDNRFLFVSNIEGNFQVYSSNDSSTQLIRLTGASHNHLNPLFSNNRKEIAFSANPSLEYQIFIMDYRGQNIRQVTNIPVAGYHNEGTGFCWWPDNGGFIYSHYDKLYSIDRNGANLRVVATAPPGRNFGACDYSSVTGRIVVQTVGTKPYEGEIYLMNGNGTDTVRIVDDLPGIVGNPSFSIDGRKILYTHDVSGLQSGDGRQLDARVFVYDLDSMSHTDLSVNKPAGTNDLRPRYSPFGSQIIFTNSLNDMQSEVSVYVMDLEGANRTLFFEHADMPHWK